MDFPVLAFFCLVFLFGVIAARQSKKVRSVYDFFHSEKLSLNALSYIAANLTLGTGVAYIFSAVSILKSYFFVAPVCMLLGYICLSLIFEKLGDESLFRDNWIKGLSEGIDESLGKSSHFQMGYSAVLCLVFLLVLAFEIFASSKLLSHTLFNDPSTIDEAIVGGCVFSVVLLYCVLSGYKAVLETDRLQFVFILLLLAVIFVISGKSDQITLSPIHDAFSFPELPLALIAGVVSSGLAAFNTQFYSVLNLSAASQQSEAKKRRKLFLSIGVGSFLIISFWVFIANWMSASGIKPSEDLAESIALSREASGVVGRVIFFVLVGGLFSILFSTVDTLIVSITQLAYSNFAGRDSSDRSSGIRDLKNVRLSMVTIGPVIFTSLAACWFLKPDLYNLLLSIVSGTDVLVPMIVLLFILNKRRELSKLRMLNQSVLLIFLLLFITAVASSITLTFAGLWHARLVGPLFFALSSILATIVVFRKPAS